MQNAHQTRLLGDPAHLNKGYARKAAESKMLTKNLLNQRANQSIALLLIIDSLMDLGIEILLDELLLYVLMKKMPFENLSSGGKFAHF